MPNLQSFRKSDPFSIDWPVGFARRGIESLRDQRSYDQESDTGARSNEVHRKTVVRSGTLFVNPTTFEVVHDDRFLRLTSTEVKLLLTLMENHGRIVNHKGLEPAIRGESVYGVTDWVQRLCRNIGDSTEDPAWISCVPGEGYRFIGPDPEYLDLGGTALSLFLGGASSWVPDPIVSNFQTAYAPA